MYLALIDAGKLDEFNAAEDAPHARADKAKACLRQSVKIEMSGSVSNGNRPVPGVGTRSSPITS
jgi:hypothetical protein